MSCEFAHDDAAYVLGALPPDERLAFERHLATCDDCSRSVRSIAGLTGLLSRVPLEVVESEPRPEPVPPTLLPSLVREVRRSQVRRRWVAGLAAAAVLVVGAGVTTAVVATRDDPTPPAAVGQTMTQVDQDSVEASVALTSVAWGTKLDLTCTYDEPASAYGEHHEPPTYAMVVRSADGDTQQVATWRGLPGKTMHVSGATALTADDIASVEVVAADGHALLELNG
ncbi:anti-sigma factor family protein [Nocardioides mangrovi]|uniref:Zf-HC2 domain-containing protein n=1 Tax=Nocardioides mangrovi TaxID=2874580 RepID=A0ABS7UHW2_9ACTN|nr:zf-HC2 domain-containing protein [Nocardioides mangrovi]MBZ5740619.1 zf-HC2 domain-containing protein [Nocardioides mangrovi]